MDKTELVYWIRDAANSICGQTGAETHQDKLHEAADWIEQSAAGEGDWARELSKQDNFILTFYDHDRNGDWACIQCKPHNDLTTAGFLCGYHRAKARASIADTEGTK